MYHTLLPLDQRNALRREYRVRAAIVFLFMISVAFIIGVVALFPAYFKVLDEEKSALTELASATGSSGKSGLSDLEKNVSKDQALLGSLSDGLSDPRASLLIEKLVGVRGEIKLRGFSVADIASSSATITIQGNAPTRDSLQSFQKRLEVLSGKKISLPVSELAKSSNIDFSLQVRVALP